MVQSSSIPNLLVISASNIQLAESIGQGTIVCVNLKSSVTMHACMFLQLSSLWSGEFGIVYKGYIVEDTTDIVAIKTLKGDCILHNYSYLIFRLHIIP